MIPWGQNSPLGDNFAPGVKVLRMLLKTCRSHLNGPLEEPLAAFAGDDAVVEAGRLVLADVADQRLLVLRGRQQQRRLPVLRRSAQIWVESLITPGLHQQPKMFWLYFQR
jgi:hypothetical protein